MVVGGININSPPTPPISSWDQQVLPFMSLHSLFYAFLQKQRLSKEKKKFFMVGLCSIVINKPFTGTQTGGGRVAWLNFTGSGKCGG